MIRERWRTGEIGYKCDWSICIHRGAICLANVPCRETLNENILAAVEIRAGREVGV